MKTNRRGLRGTAARSRLSFSWPRPVRRAASVRVPFLLVVPEERIQYLDMTGEQAMKMIVSAGALVPERSVSRK